MASDTANTTAGAAAGAKPTRVRLLILALITGGTMINYMDRTVLGVAAPFLSKDLRLDPAVLGVVFSAFSWTYAAAQIPGGAFLDRFGSKVTYALPMKIQNDTLRTHALGNFADMSRAMVRDGASFCANGT